MNANLSGTSSALNQHPTIVGCGFRAIECVQDTGAAASRAMIQVEELAPRSPDCELAAVGSRLWNTVVRTIGWNEYEYIFRNRCW